MFLRRLRRLTFKGTTLAARCIWTWTKDETTRITFLRTTIRDTLQKLHTTDDTLKEIIDRITRDLNDNVELFELDDDTLYYHERLDCIRELENMHDELYPIQRAVYLCEPDDQKQCLVHIVPEARVKDMNEVNVAFGEQLATMYRESGTGNEVVHSGSSFVVLCTMEYAYGLLKLETGHHIKKVRPDNRSKTRHLHRLRSLVKVVPSSDLVGYVLHFNFNITTRVTFD